MILSAWLFGLHVRGFNRSHRHHVTFCCRSYSLQGHLYAASWQRINKCCHFQRPGFQAAAFPHTGGSCHRTSASTKHSGNFPSVCALRTDLAVTHTQSLSRARTLWYKSARISRNITPILRETWAWSRLTFILKAAPPPPKKKKNSLMKSAEKGLSVWVPQTPPLLVAWEGPTLWAERPHNTIYSIINGRVSSCEHWPLNLAMTDRLIITGWSILA